MKMDANYECCHEQLLQDHSLKITELEKEVQFKKEKMDSMQMKIDEIDKKVDKINENVNKIVLASTQSDNYLELRLQANETEIKNLKEELSKKETENDNLINRRIAIIGLILTVVTIGINLIFHFI